MKPKTAPSAGALRAATEITRRIQQGSLSPAWTNTIAQIIDRETDAAELAEALEWALGKTDPSPCRCMSFAGTPHVCVAHKALARYHGTP